MHALAEGNKLDELNKVKIKFREVDLDSAE